MKVETLILLMLCATLTATSVYGAANHKLHSELYPLSFKSPAFFNDDSPPVIDKVTIVPSPPQPYEDFDLYIFTHDEESETLTVVVSYYVNDEFRETIHSQQVNETTWKATIPGQEYGSTVKLNITVTDTAGNIAFEVRTIQIPAPEEQQKIGFEISFVELSTIIGLAALIVLLLLLMRRMST
ncbi:MAG TPA: hypothetical protein ENG22_04830 [Candidatus Bathyarchaeota archaeon]|nr:hypothetical protein [Candidatus Bathyarchaeota archaeon]